MLRRHIKVGTSEEHKATQFLFKMEDVRIKRTGTVSLTFKEQMPVGK